MNKLREEIQEIECIVREAFDDIEIIECSPDGLLNYIMDGNEAFMYEEQEDDKLCYLYAFKQYLLARSLDFPEARMMEIDNTIDILKEKYPDQYNVIVEICNHI